MRKVWDFYYYDEKGMTIIVNKLNVSLLWHIYNIAYIIIKFTRLLYFRVIKYHQLGKN